MIVAFDIYYYNGYSYTVGGVFESWADSDVCYYVTNKRNCIDAEYESGELYKRELSCIMQCLSMIDLKNIDAIIVDGYVWLSEDGKGLTKGLGARLADAIAEKYDVNDISVVGIAKNPYHIKIPNCIEIKHGLDSNKPLYVTCSNPEFAEYYSVLAERMNGDYRIPTILKLIDAKTRELKDKNEHEIAEQTKPIEIDFGTFDEWVKETEKNGFKWR